MHEATAVFEEVEAVEEDDDECLWPLCVVVVDSVVGGDTTDEAGVEAGDDCADELSLPPPEPPPDPPEHKFDASLTE